MSGRCGGRPKKALNSSARLRHFFRESGIGAERLEAAKRGGWRGCCLASRAGVSPGVVLRAGGGGRACLPAARRGPWSRCLGSKSRSKWGKSQVQGWGSRRDQNKAPCWPQGKLAGSMVAAQSHLQACSEQWAVAPSWSKFRLFYLQRPPQRQRQLAPA